MAKLIVTAPSRGEAIELARAALAQTEITGPGANLAFLARVLEDPRFVAGTHDTGLATALTAPVASRS